MKMKQVESYQFYLFSSLSSLTPASNSATDAMGQARGAKMALAPQFDTCPGIMNLREFSPVPVSTDIQKERGLSIDEDEQLLSMSDEVNMVGLTTSKHPKISSSYRSRNAPISDAVNDSSSSTSSTAKSWVGMFSRKDFRWVAHTQSSGRSRENMGLCLILGGRSCPSNGKLTIQSRVETLGLQNPGTGRGAPQVCDE